MHTVSNACLLGLLLSTAGLAQHADGPRRMVALRSFHGTYVVAEPDGGLHCNREGVGAWERFVLIPHEDGTVSLRSCHGKYVVAEPAGAMFANRDGIGGWERFALIQHEDGTVSLRSDHGLFVAAEPAGVLVANRGGLGDWERFRIEDQDIPVCPQCGEPHQDRAQFCRSCPPPRVVRICPHCGEGSTRSVKFWTCCGREVEE